MSAAAETKSTYDEVLEAVTSLDDFGVEAYVHVGQPGGHYIGASVLFRYRPDADLRFPAMALAQRISKRFAEDRPFREAMSRECFQLGSYLQNWNDPVPDPNF